MSTIVIRLNGGLGNQMFQYALGRCLALTHRARLLFDMDFFDLPPGPHTPRTYTLDAFNVRCDRASPEDIRLARQGGSHLRAWLHDMHPRLAPDRAHRERGFAYDPSLLSVRRDTYFDGYWQSELYFSGATEILRNEFTFRQPLSPASATVAQMFGDGPAVSVHVRRGDYISHPAASVYFVPCDQDYYSEAIRRMLDDIPSARFFVFSDDPAWARQHIRSEAPVHFVEASSGSPAADDMHLMSLCDHHVIANSSFSWWGAWLNAEPGKRVIAPARWFTDPRMDTRDLIPTTWTRI